MPATRCRSTGPHGTYWAYGKGCRCFAARVDESNYRTRRRSGNPIELVRDATGACRIAQGLSVCGFTVAQIAAASGLSDRLIAQLHCGKPTIRTVKDKALRAGAHKLLAGAPPTGPSAAMARGAAKRNGWVPLHCWDDDTIDDPAASPDLGDERPDLVDPVAVERALAGERVRLTDAERDEAFRAGLARGMSGHAISVALRLSSFTYRRIVARITETQAA